MGYPIKTSNDDWLNKAIQLYHNRVSIDLIDDANYGLTLDSEIIEVFSKATLKVGQFIWTSIFYVFALVSAYLFVRSFSVTHAKEVSLIFSGVGVILCLLIPSLVFHKNKAPKVFKDGDIIKVTF